MGDEANEIHVIGDSPARERRSGPQNFMSSVTGALSSTFGRVREFASNPNRRTPARPVDEDDDVIALSEMQTLPDAAPRRAVTRVLRTPSAAASRLVTGAAPTDMDSRANPQGRGRRGRGGRQRGRARAPGQPRRPNNRFRPDQWPSGAALTYEQQRRVNANMNAYINAQLALVNGFSPDEMWMDPRDRQQMELLRAPAPPSSDPRMRAALANPNRDFNDADYEFLLSLDNDVAQRGGMAVEDLSMIPVSTVQPGARVHDCTVCLVGMEPGERIMTLPCAHVFHSACMESWLVIKAKCPICQSDPREVAAGDIGGGGATTTTTTTTTNERKARSGGSSDPADDGLGDWRRDGDDAVLDAAASEARSELLAMLGDPSLGATLSMEAREGGGPLSEVASAHLAVLRRKGVCARIVAAFDGFHLRKPPRRVRTGRAGAAAAAAEADADDRATGANQVVASALAQALARASDSSKLGDGFDDDDDIWDDDEDETDPKRKAGYEARAPELSDSSGDESTD